MPLVQRMILLVASLCFLAFVLHLVKKKRLSTKYSLLWIVLSCAGIAAAAFPGWVFWLTDLFGFGLPVNMLFFGCIFFLMAATFSCVSIASDQSEHIRDLIQEVSLLKQRVEILEHENELLNEAALRRPDSRP